MQTPWGDIEVTDAHVHFFSHSFFKALAQQKGQPDNIVGLLDQLGWQAPPVDNSALGAQWAAELDRHGVSRSVLMSSLPEQEASAADAVRALLVFLHLLESQAERPAQFLLAHCKHFPAHAHSAADMPVNGVWSLLGDGVLVG